MLNQLFRRLRQKSRIKRYHIFQKLIKVNDVSGSVLNLVGGPVSFFKERCSKHKHTILVEIKPEVARLAKSKIPAINVIIADAGQLPYAKQSMAFTVCNCVIEHVTNPQRLANKIQRVNNSYFLQTPNGRFPLETHSFITIRFFSWLPNNWLKRAVCKVVDANFNYVHSANYISDANLRNLFPILTPKNGCLFTLKHTFLTDSSCT